MNNFYTHCPAYAAVNRGKPIRVFVKTPVTFSEKQVEALVEAACARSFQHDGLACISLLDLEMILQKGATAFDE